MGATAKTARPRRTMNERFPEAAELIRRDYEAFTSAIRAIVPPDNHGWSRRPRDLDFWRGDVFASTEIGNDTRLKKWWDSEGAPDKDARTAHEDQVMITVRDSSASRTARERNCRSVTTPGDGSSTAPSSMANAATSSPSTARNSSRKPRCTQKRTRSTTSSISSDRRSRLPSLTSKLGERRDCSDLASSAV